MYVCIQKYHYTSNQASINVQAKLLNIIIELARLVYWLAEQTNQLLFISKSQQKWYPNDMIRSKPSAVYIFCTPKKTNTGTPGEVDIRVIVRGDLKARFQWKIHVENGNRVSFVHDWLNNSKRYAQQIKCCVRARL